MSEGFSSYLAGAVLAWVKSTAMPADPAAVYAALFNGDPSAGGTEVTATIDATGRKAVTFGAVASKAMSNSADVDFGTADGGATVSYWGLYDAASAGNLLFYSPLETTRVVVTADPVKFAIGDLTIDLNTTP